MLKVIGSAGTRARRVLWALEEIGLPYQHDAAPPRSEAVTRLNPSGKVPVLIDGEAVLTDSTAILHYLADRHGALTFPAGTVERARQDAFTFRVLDEIEGPLWMAAKHSFILPEEMRVAAVKDSLRWEFSEALGRIAADIENCPFLMGEAMTVADIVLAHCLGWARAARFPVEQPVLVAYFDRLMARPAAQKVYA